MKPIVCIDLDGTLTYNDVFKSCWLRNLSKSKVETLLTLVGLIKGRAFFKQYFFHKFKPELKDFLINEKILTFLKDQKKQGASLYLVTGNDYVAAKFISDHLNIFDDFFSSNGLINLKGEVKAKFLVNKFGVKNFDYIGNSSDDIPVWKQARNKFATNASFNLIKIIKKEYADMIYL